MQPITPIAGTVCLPGHDAPCNEQPIRQPNLESWALSLLDRLPQNQPLNLCGWSLGGMVALKAASLAPQRIQRVAVIGSGIVFARQGAFLEGAGPEAMSEFEAGCADPARLLKRFLALATWGMGRTEGKAIGGQVLPQPGDNMPTPDVLRAGLEILQNADLTPVASKIRAPVLVIHGMRDRVCHPELGKALAGVLARTTEVSFTLHGQAGHAPHWSHPGWVAETLRSFQLASGVD
ncbi:MAG: hypothetical protein COX57_05160 [Alphaproteobacteria bacterium CG_4_10_14_0_2_um_filter_63_37]|nr:MAG: hypothetical protein COX57_05160 [Alphaproteobacteria bacterium CG_4_10_14_0_2_um_filter_63_37]